MSVPLLKAKENLRGKKTDKTFQCQMSTKHRLLVENVVKLGLTGMDLPGGCRGYDTPSPTFSVFFGKFYFLR